MKSQEAYMEFFNEYIKAKKTGLNMAATIYLKKIDEKIEAYMLVGPYDEKSVQMIGGMYSITGNNEMTSLKDLLELIHYLLTEDIHVAFAYAEDK